VKLLTNINTQTTCIHLSGDKDKKYNYPDNISR